MGPFRRVEELVCQEEVAPVKKGRGRPAGKAKKAASEDEEDLPPAKPKGKGRGRPPGKKAKKEVEDEDEEEEDGEDEEAPAKKATGRGRPAGKAKKATVYKEDSKEEVRRKGREERAREATRTSGCQEERVEPNLLR